MKREILFRGLRVDGGGLVEGLISYNMNGEMLITSYSDDKYYSTSDLVIPDSICQFTGLTDKNGKKIFENDKLRDDWEELDEIVEDYCVVVWDKENGQWAIDNSYEKDGSSYTNLVDYLGRDNLEVIGNIHEN